MNYQIFKNQKKSYTINLPTDFDKVYAFHTSMKEYQVTPLHDLKELAKKYHVSRIYVKDESYRFHLNAFKGLGVSYAASQIKGNHTFVTCTDGNHGKAVAWYAYKTHQKAIIFMPQGSEERRIKAIEAFGAKVIVTNMNYDDTVRYAYDYATNNDYILLQDTALDHYTDIPTNIILGYSTLIHEALIQMQEKPTHIFLQAGVGSLVGGITWYLHHYYDNLPIIGIIEAFSCACIYESIKNDEIVKIGGHPQTIMAGLNCGEANPITLPILKAYASYFIKCDDDITLKGMYRALNPIGDDPSFSSGESGAVGLGLIETLLENNDQTIQFDQNSKILVINTEGVLE
ncbi:MAG: diaminopropionate ammonia-lyase [Erysipelotrichaceae bacterium]|nr:diaminopropionate ammonia-lyase [Erysipelotrichaceae bacterium]